MTPSLDWHAGLAPGHTRDAAGTLHIGDISAQTLAQRHGTPLLTIDFGVLDAAVEACRSACAPFAIEAAYAGKALLLVGLAQRIADSGIGLDVCSLGELVTAERGSFPAERITLHGCGKSGDELEAAVEGRVGRIVVDGVGELKRLANIGKARQPVRLLLRLNTGIEAHTHAFVRTGGEDTKFGIVLADEEAALNVLQENTALRFLGLHAHIGSQISDSAAFIANAEALVEAAARFSRAGFPVTEIVIGGGFGVTTNPDREDDGIDFASTIAAAANTVRDASVRLGIEKPSIGIEPGRWLIARAGTTLYRVCAVKRQGERTFVIVDGGLYENPRPALYGAYHHAVAVTQMPAPVLQPVTLCGRSCENDVLGPAMLPTTLREGDLIALCTTGAYTYSMASNYNRFPRPEVIAVDAGRDFTLARRESLDHVLANDTLA